MTPQQVIAGLCRQYGRNLKLPQGSTLDGAKVLWALAGCESDFGARAVARHEPGYCYGHIYDPKELSGKWGCLAHCSYGPWQMMYPHLVTYSGIPITPMDFTIGAGWSGPGFTRAADRAALAAKTMLNEEVLGRQQATTLEQIAKTWNHGNWRDDYDDSAYTDRAAKFYATDFPAEATQ